MKFADNLKSLRKERNLSQEDFAEIIGVTRQSISKWEIGEGYPDVEKLLLIAKSFNISLDWLMGLIPCFEDLCNLDKQYVLDKLNGLDTDIVVKAYMGTSPQNAAWMKSTFENIDFEERRKNIGRIPINEVEISQKTILNLLQE